MQTREQEIFEMERIRHFIKSKRDGGEHGDN